MAEPSKKSQEMEEFLDHLSGRTSAIRSNVCIPRPFGCGGPATEFRDPLRAKEYLISGLCQECQDRIFGKN